MRKLSLSMYMFVIGFLVMSQGMVHAESGNNEAQRAGSMSAHGNAMGKR